jgi:hypothetical protein
LVIGRIRLTVLNLVADRGRALGNRLGTGGQITANTFSHRETTLQSFTQRFDLARMQQLIRQVSLAHQNLQSEVSFIGRKTGLVATLIRRCIEGIFLRSANVR